MEPHTDQSSALRVAARAEHMRMREALAQIRPGGAIRVTRDQFERMATMIERLAALPDRKDDEAFGMVVDGLRWWVPLPEFERVRGELDQLRTRCDGISLDPLVARSLY